MFKYQNNWVYMNDVCLRVCVQGVKSLGGHFACLCRGFEFYEVKKNYSEKSSKRAK